jgi:hypothetical protein
MNLYFVAHGFVLWAIAVAASLSLFPLNASGGCKAAVDGRITQQPTHFRLLKTEKLQQVSVNIGSVVYLVNLHSEIASVSSISIHAGRIVVLGAMNSADATAVIIYDTDARATIDEFWAYNATISPDGKWLIFLKFFPSHFVDSPEYQYRIYSLDLTPAQNRHADSVQSGSTATSSKVDVGTPIWPASISEAMRPNIGINVKNAHIARSPFFWSANSNYVSFIDEHEGYLNLVTVVLTAGTNPTATGHTIQSPRATCLSPNAQTHCDRLVNIEFCIDFQSDLRTQRVSYLRDGEKKLLVTLEMAQR